MNMEFVLEIIKLLAPVVLGGGLSWVISWRRAKKKFERKLASEEYHDVDDIVQRFTQRISAQAMQNSETLQLLMDIEEENSKITRENRLLKAEIQELKERLRINKSSSHHEERNPNT